MDKQKFNHFLNTDLNDLLSIISENILEKGKKLQDEEKQSLPDFINDYSKMIDSLILNIQEKEKLNYIAGTLNINLHPNQKMQLALDLYFKNQLNAWVNKKSLLPMVEMTDCLNDKAISELLQSGDMQLDIEKPINP